VLEYGVLEDWLIIRDYYGVERIGEIAMEFRILEPRALAFIANLANKNIEDFRCYKLRPLTRQHWPY
jgi:hypothetical protein